MSIEENRKEKDPMYRLLFCPDNDFMDKFIKTGQNMIYKKYGKKLQQNDCIANTFDLMLSRKYGNDDVMIKVFGLLSIMCREVELANAFEKHYQTDGGIHETKGPQRFRKTLTAFRTSLNRLMQIPYNQTNIVKLIHDIVIQTRKIYWMGENLQ